MAATEPSNSAKQTVVVVGSGLAGLATAYLLNSDPCQRYSVTVLECDSNFSFDSASVSIRDEDQKTKERIDMPMRAFAQGYYNNLIRMYDYLGIRYNRQLFVYTFSKKNDSPVQRETTQNPYFVHTSNNHKLPPIRPDGMGLFPWLLDLVYVAACYLWWSLCCFWVPPKPATHMRECESLNEYMRRIMLPRRFVVLYLVPLLASVATCTHEALLQFPARDLIEYKKQSAGGQHFRVTELDQVQRTLGAGLDVRFSTAVKKVEAVQRSKKVRISSTTSDGFEREETFDHVVLAVAPGVVGKIYQPLERAMTQIPSTLVESVAQTSGMKWSPKARESVSGEAHTLHFRTSTVQAQTESIHVYPSGAIVTTCPFNDISSAENVVKSAKFFRGLRTPRSRRIVNNIFGENMDVFRVDDKDSVWRNGDDNVWLVGGWCWDGMVLLEGCVVSAVRVAQAFDIDIPWRSTSL